MARAGTLEKGQELHGLVKLEKAGQVSFFFLTYGNKRVGAHTQGLFSMQSGIHACLQSTKAIAVLPTTRKTNQKHLGR